VAKQYLRYYGVDGGPIWADRALVQHGWNSIFAKTGGPVAVDLAADGGQLALIAPPTFALSAALTPASKVESHAFTSGGWPHLEPGLPLHTAGCSITALASLCDGCGARSPPFLEVRALAMLFLTYGARRRQYPLCLWTRLVEWLGSAF
jgi:hypothetical protein